MNVADSYNEGQRVVAAVKIFLLLLTGCSVHRSLSPPNPSVKTEECCSGTEGTETLFERIVQSVTFCSKAMVWLGVFCDVIYITFRLFPVSTIMNNLQGGWIETYPDDPLNLARSFNLTREHIPAMMTLGATLALAAAALRTWCFNSMGPFFTFEITIRPKHRLIMVGPYAWVRHPSYTGVYLTLIGSSLVLFAPGSWLVEAGYKTFFGALFALFWTLKCAFVFKGMLIRFRAEDAVLRENFGAQWDDYATRVPNKFIPGLY